jgi:VIT1/CCC1 family predicted Fe2+/Mn2+ transporter
MLTDELGIVEREHRAPAVDAILIGLSFMAGGIIPVVPFVPPLPHPQLWAYVLTAITALAFGAIKARYTLKGPVRSGLEFLVVITVGTLAGAVVGLVLHAG